MRLLACLALALGAAPAAAYPTDQYARTGICRLEWQRQVDAGEARGIKTPPGGQWPTDRIALRLLDVGRDFELTAATPKDADLQAGLEKALAGRFRRYAVALLDISDPAAMRYAAMNETQGLTPGSVAKVLVATALLAELRARFPNDVAKREEALRTIKVAADDWALPDDHEVPIISGDKLEVAVYRRIRAHDAFSLWEWMDHALSPSSNGAASLLWREAMLMRLDSAQYPPPRIDAALWKTWTRDQLTEAAMAVVDEPLRAAGIGADDLHLRMFFTHRANQYVRSQTSRVTPLGLVQWMLRVEQGRMVDGFSSLELKRMLYLTRRRVRYASAPELNDAAVYFKSGSLYRCKPESACVAYQGDEVNVLNALAEVETVPDAVVRPNPPKPVAYMVAVLSNELSRNASSDHALLAGAIHRLMVGEP